jgi:hypothetical protein
MSLNILNMEYGREEVCSACQVRHIQHAEHAASPKALKGLVAPREQLQTEKLPSSGKDSRYWKRQFP